MVIYFNHVIRNRLHVIPLLSPLRDIHCSHFATKYKSSKLELERKDPNRLGEHKGPISTAWSNPNAWKSNPRQICMGLGYDLIKITLSKLRPTVQWLRKFCLDKVKLCWLTQVLPPCILILRESSIVKLIKVVQKWHSYDRFWLFSFHSCLLKFGAHVSERN